MASQKAKQVDFLIAGVSNSSNQPLKAGKAYFWESSAKTTPKNVWLDQSKTTIASQPIILGNSGEAIVFGDGTYYVEIYDKNDVLIKTISNINYSAEVDFGGLYVDVGALYGFGGSEIQNAINDVDSSLNYVFLFKDGTFLSNQNMTIPSNVVIKVMPTATISISNGVTLTVLGDIEASNHEIFTGTGTLSLSGVLSLNSNWYASSLNITQSLIVDKTSSFTASNEKIILCDATTAPIIVTLPNAIGQELKKYKIKKTDGTNNTVTITPTQSQTIDGQASHVLAVQNSLVSIVSDGSNWIVIKEEKLQTFKYVPYWDFKTFHVNVSATVGNSFVPEFITGLASNSSTLYTPPWENTLALQNKIKLVVRWKGIPGGTTSQSRRVRILTTSGINLFESYNNFILGIGDKYYIEREFDLHQNNVVDFDIYQHPLLGINTSSNSTLNTWGFEHAGWSGSSVYSNPPNIVEFYFYWMK